MLNTSYYSYFFVEKNPTFSYFSVKKAPTFFLLFGEWLLEGLLSQTFVIFSQFENKNKSSF